MKPLRFLRFTIVLVLVGQFFLTWSWAHADEMTCPIHTPVSIDIKPGSYPNSINLSSSGLVAVAVLTTQDFDANQFTPEMAHLFDVNTPMGDICGSPTALRWKLEDVNGDKRLDMLFFFDTQSLNLTSASTAATLMAHGAYGSTVLHIMGTDAVKVKG
jgi:hypothetical protein